jgi:hypothetical protein
MVSQPPRYAGVIVLRMRLQVCVIHFLCDNLTLTELYSFYTADDIPALSPYGCERYYGISRFLLREI